MGEFDLRRKGLAGRIDEAVEKLSRRAVDLTRNLGSKADLVYDFR